MTDLSNWRPLFDAALDAAKGNKAVVAEQLDVSRTMVSLVANDKYHARLDAFAQRVIDTYGGFDCPHLGERITGNACKAYALRAAPTSSARDARHWLACQTCPHKPTEVTKP
jgi:hypothetical protein